MLKLICSVMFITASLIAIPSGASSQDSINPTDLRMLTGEVEMVDSLHSTLLVRWIDDLRTVSKDEMIVTVTKETIITKGTSHIKLDQLNVGDRVSVRYYLTAFSGAKAATIVVKN